MKLFAMRDEYLGFMCPTAMETDQAAIRSFKTAVQSGKVQYPENIFLYCLGEYDSKTGFIDPEVRCLCCGVDFLNVEQIKANSVSCVEGGEVCE